MNLKKYKLHIFGFLVTIYYIIWSRLGDLHTASTIFVTVATIVAGISIWIQLKRDCDLKEAEFLLGYNSKFIFDSNLTDVQQILEQHRNGVIPDSAIEEMDRQQLINYIVYLEALSPLVKNSILNIETMDNLYSYRFFLAVNNPVVQRIELVPEAEYYKGCFNLHKQWELFKKKNNMPILMESSSLRYTEVYQQMSK